ncbi:MAG: hypothetical protein PF689_05665 [Deltaproteobacteria bacterium]|jgi:hypothetical protein|nr:hypothetical protein [Deltaproteobacteria bacterium]
MKFSKLEFTNCKLKHSQIPKLRGYIGNVFKDYNLIHNHRENGKNEIIAFYVFLCILWLQIERFNHGQNGWQNNGYRS